MASSTHIALLFDNFPAMARADLTEAMNGITAELKAMVIGREPKRTGRLQAETQSFVDVDDNRIRGKVKILSSSAVEFGKAGALEYGAPGARHRTKVLASKRTQSVVFGHLMAPREVLIAAHDRTPQIAAQSFMRGPLQELESSIMDRIRATLAKSAERATAEAAQ